MYLECPYLLLYQLRSEEKAAEESVEGGTIEKGHIPDFLKDYDQSKWDSLLHLVPRHQYSPNSDDQTLLKAFLEARKAPSMPESGASLEELAKWRSFCSNPGIDGVGEQPLLIAPHVAFRFGPLKWASDGIINSYGRLIQEAGKGRILVLDTFWWTAMEHASLKLLKGLIKNVSRLQFWS